MKRQMTLNKKITQKELAKLANVSQSTVSTILSNLPLISRIPKKTQRIVLDLAASRNYIRNSLARQLRIAKSDIVGVIVPHVFSYYLQDLLIAIESCLFKEGYSMVVLKINKEDINVGENLRKMIGYNYHGIICLEHFSKNDPFQILKILSSYGNIVYLDKPTGLVSQRYVSVNYAAGIAEAVQHLVERGRKRIALCLNDRIYLSMKGRLAGYRTGLKRCGIPYNHSLCWCASDYELSGQDASPLSDIALHIYGDVIKELKADAIITSNDEWAVALIKTLRGNGHKVPGEISVVGYGDISSLCWACEPELSSISHGNTDIAFHICRLVLTSKGSDDNKIVNVKSRLVIRQSS